LSLGWAQARSRSRASARGCSLAWWRWFYGVFAPCRPEVIRAGEANMRAMLSGCRHLRS
jgi:hypothetical protein